MTTKQKLCVIDTICKTPKMQNYVRYMHQRIHIIRNYIIRKLQMSTNYLHGKSQCPWSQEQTN